MPPAIGIGRAVRAGRMLKLVPLVPAPAGTPAADSRPARRAARPGGTSPGGASGGTGPGGRHPRCRARFPVRSYPTHSPSWEFSYKMFWLVLAMGVTRLTAPAGWLTLILSFTTCTIPGFLLLLGEWGHVGTWLVLVIIAATVVAVAPVTVRSLRQPAEVPDPAEAEAGVPVSVS